jgi:hypothetical protein
VSERKDPLNFIFVLTIPRHGIVLTITHDNFLDLDIRKSLSEFNVNQSLLPLLFAGAITTF